MKTIKRKMRRFVKVDFLIKEKETFWVVNICNSIHL